MPTLVSRPPYRRAEPGGDLPDRIEGRLPSLPATEAMRVLMAMGAILDHAEREGTPHGDLGVEAITVSGDAVAVSGFGVSRNTTRAPEGKPRGTATDRYGFGVIAVQLLTRSTARPKLDEEGPEDAVRPIADIVSKIAGKEDTQLLVIEIVDLLRPEPGERPDPLRLAAVASHVVSPVTEMVVRPQPVLPPSVIPPVPLAPVIAVAVAFVLLAGALVFWALTG